MDFTEAKDWLFKSLGPSLGGFICFLFKDLTNTIKEINAKMNHTQEQLKHIEEDLKSLKRLLKRGKDD